MKRFLSVLAVVAFLVSFGSTTPASANGFDQFGYNRQARIFDGPASGWCLQRGAPANCLGVYSNDHLVMKWNAEWDRGNKEGWSKPPYAAYLDNEWNGNVPGGSGWTEHFKTKWIGPCSEGATLPDGGYCIWGQFDAVMDHGSDPNHDHWVTAHAIPNGYGAP